MSTLLWDGRGAVAARASRAEPGANEVLVEVEHTLYELLPTRHALACVGHVRQRGRGVRIPEGTRVVARTAEATSELVLLARHCVALDATNALADLLVPVVIELTSALRQIALEPGWNAVIAGEDLRADLLLQLVAVSGARSVASVRTQAPVPPDDKSFAGSPSEYQTQLTEYCRGLRGPVCALDTAGNGGVIQALLSALPPRGRLVLLGGRNNGSAAVNFYTDVHRKNTLIEAPRCNGHSRDDVLAAKRLLESRLDCSFFCPPHTTASHGSHPSSAAARWIILDWAPDRGRAT